MTITTIILLMLLAFCFETVDSTYGMGYGTLFVPIMIMFFGLEPLIIVPAVMVSEMSTGLLSGSLFHIYKVYDIWYNKKIILLLLICSFIGAFLSLVLVVKLNPAFIKSYITWLVIIMGLILLVAHFGKWIFKFNYWKIFGLGFIASFNKVISGGGFGPIVTTGQILSGIPEKTAVGITSLVEGFVCMFSVIVMIIMHRKIDLVLLSAITIGACCASPFATWLVKRIDKEKFKLTIAIITLTVGILSLLKIGQ